MRAQQTSDGTWAFSILGGTWMDGIDSIHAAKRMGWSDTRWSHQAATAIGRAKAAA